MPYSPRPSPAAPTAPSTASAWDRPAAYASKVVDAASPASRTSATIPGCALCCRSQKKGNSGFLIWHDDQLPALIDWEDPVVKHGLAHRIKYARLVQRTASSPHAQRRRSRGYRYVVQLVLEGTPYHKPKHTVGSDTIGADLGPSTIAIVPREGEASLELFCEELAPDARAMRRLQRKMERQRRAANPEHYDERGRIKKRGKQKLPGKAARATRRPGDAKRPKSAGWPPIARACMAA